MTLGIQSSILRWGSVAALSVLGWVFASLILTVACDSLSQATSSLASLGESWLVFFTIVISAALVYPLCRTRPCAFLGIPTAVAYPPLWTPVAVGALLMVTLGPSDPVCSASTWLSYTTAEAAFGVLVGIALALTLSGLRWRVTRPAQRKYLVHGISAALLRDPNFLDEWLDEDDSPIVDPKHDLFGHRRVARRMARRFSSSTQSTTWLRGIKGSGKTSVFRLIEHYLKHKDVQSSQHTPTLSRFNDQVLRKRTAARQSRRRVRLVRVSAWEFSDARSLLRGVLSAIVRTTHDEADAYALIGLPTAYVTAVSSAGGIIGSLASALTPESEPMYALERVTAILAAINVRVVVWLDDLERFHEGQGQTDEPVKALLGLIRESRYLTFVLADGSG
jgi:hypothetical protein